MKGIMEIEVNGDYYENTFINFNDRQEIRLECDEWLEDELISNGIDFYEIEIERLDEDEFKILIFDESGDCIGEGFLTIEEDSDADQLEKLFAQGHSFTR